MASRNFRLHDGKLGSALAVRVTPKASRNEITEVTEDGTVKVRLTAAPTDNQANEALVEFLSEVLRVPKTKIEIVAGLTGRDKLISVLGLDKDELQHRIVAHMG